MAHFIVHCDFTQYESSNLFSDA